MKQEKIERLKKEKEQVRPLVTSKCELQLQNLVDSYCDLAGRVPRPALHTENTKLPAEGREAANLGRDGPAAAGHSQLASGEELPPGRPTGAASRRPLLSACCEGAEVCNI